MSDLVPFGEDIWLLEGDTAHMYGVPFPTRAVIVRLKDGQLWVHSPVSLTPERIAEINELGPLGFLVEPNKIHSLGLAAWKAEWPDAVSWVSPEFRDRHPDIDADIVLDDEAPPAWADEIGQKVIAGHTILDEVWFLHRPSGSLIVTDLIQKHDPDKQGALVRLLKGAAGILGEDGGTAIDIRLLFRDREAGREALDFVLGWEFDKLILSHGKCLETGAKAEVRRALSWLLEDAHN